MRWGVVLAVAVWACGTQADEQLAVDRLLSCLDDCQVLDSQVVALGDGAVAPLGRALTEVDTVGLSQYRRSLSAAYRTVPNPRRTEVEYVESYLANYVTASRTRAAGALGSIGTPQALAVLRGALTQDSTVRDSTGRPFYREVERRAIEAAVARAESDSMTAAAPDGASLFDTVTVVSSGAAAIDGNTTLRLVGSPFEDDLLLDRVADTLRFIVVGRVGPAVLRLDSLGSGERSQAKPFHITSAYAWNRPIRPLDSVPELPLRDSVRFYRRLSDESPSAFVRIGVRSRGAVGSLVVVPVVRRFEPAAPGRPPVRLVAVGWRHEPPPPPVQTGVLEGRVLAHGRDPLANQRVSVDGTPLEVSTAPDGTFRIPGLPAGTYTVRVRGIGYLDARLAGVRIFASSTTVTEFHMVADSVHRYRVTAEWDGDGAVALLAHDCDSVPPSAAHDFVAGTVVDSTGQPLGGVTVRVLRRSVGPVLRTTVADGNGHFAFGGLSGDSILLGLARPARVNRWVRRDTWGVCLPFGAASAESLSFSNPAVLDVDVPAGACRVVQAVRCTTGGRSDLVRLRAAPR